MSTGPLAATKTTSGNASTEPVYFDSRGETLFGFLHLPVTAGNADLGLIICQPFGYEAICSHRSMRSVADATARAGIPTLRFDYLGTGDSADIDPSADQIDVWSHDVEAAAEELHRTTGVGRICLLGIRLGSLIAALAARRSTWVDALISISPILSGPKHVRELRRNQRISLGLKNHRRRFSNLKTSSGMAHRLSDSELQVSGFPLSAATLSHLETIDLSAETPRSGIPVLTFVNEHHPAVQQWTVGDPTSSRHNKYILLPGLAKMLATEPQFVSTPAGMVSTIRDWLLELATILPTGTAAPSRERTFAPRLTSIPLLRINGIPPDLTPLVEKPVRLGEADALFGIITREGAGTPPLRGVLILNTGADYHIGANRMSVTLARRWARMGCVVLRMDLSGIGDSETRAGDDDDDVFPRSAMNDVRCAIDYLRSSFSIDDITVAGMCSGAYHALRTAVADMPVRRVFLINPLNFFWEPGDTLAEIQLAEVVHNPDLFRRHIFSVRAWKNLLNGRLRFWRTVKGYIRHSLLGLEFVFREVARKFNIRVRSDLGLELKKITARNVRVVFVFADGEPGISLLHFQGGSLVKALGENCKIHVIDDGDHVFSESGPRSSMQDVLTEELLEERPRPGSGGLEP